jgi:hypothetical protein
MCGIVRPWALIIGAALTLAGELFVAPAAADTQGCEGTQVMRGGECRSPGAIETRGAVAQADPVEPGPRSEHTVAPVEPLPDDEGAATTHLRTVAWVGLGVAAAGLVTWAVTGSIALAETGSLKDDCPDDQCPAELQDDLDTARTLADIATVGFVVAVTGSLYGVIALLATPDRNGSDADEQGAETSASVRPLVGPGYFGLNGQF